MSSAAWLVEGAVPAQGGWITLRDAVKKALPKEVPTPQVPIAALTRLALMRRAAKSLRSRPRTRRERGA